LKLKGACHGIHCSRLSFNLCFLVPRTAQLFLQIQHRAQSACSILIMKNFLRKCFCVFKTRTLLALCTFHERRNPGTVSCKTFPKACTKYIKVLYIVHVGVQ
jgi:hypothetical protein